MGNIFQPWEGYIKPSRMIGNLYFVGTVPASTHIIDTGEGLIMIDSGFPQSLYLVIANMAEVGLSYKDIKYIVHTHGHYDHLGATRALKELTGAKTFLGYRDREMANGTVDLTWARELGARYYESFEPDVLIKDGDKITLGNTEILCVETPGHTDGTMSFFFDITDNGNTYTCGMFGGFGLNTLKKEWLDCYGLPYTCREEYINSIDKVVDMRVDVFLGNHVGNNDTCGKLKRLEALKQGEPNPFIEPNQWRDVLLQYRQKVTELIENG